MGAEDGGRCRRFCFTLNNPTASDREKLESLGDKLKVVYMVCGDEVGAEGTPHIQGFVVFKHARCFRLVKRALGGRVHLEVAKGSTKQASDYCKKDGKFKEYGLCPVDGRFDAAYNKCRWSHAIEMAREGRFEEIAPDLRVRYKNTLESFYDDACKATECVSVLDHLWIFGATGTGKSRYVFDKFPGAYRKALNKWWCHYVCEDVVVIEDVDPSQEKWLGHLLKIWSDHYPFIAERKGGSRSIRPKRIIITSNYRLSQVFRDVDGILKPLQRRFKECTMVNGELVYVRDAAAIALVALGLDHYAEI
jgi:hypothetical protein